MNVADLEALPVGTVIHHRSHPGATPNPWTKTEEGMFMSGGGTRVTAPSFYGALISNQVTIAADETTTPAHTYAQCRLTPAFRATRVSSLNVDREWDYIPANQIPESMGEAALIHDDTTLGWSIAEQTVRSYPALAPAMGRRGFWVSPSDLLPIEVTPQQVAVAALPHRQVTLADLPRAMRDAAPTGVTSMEVPIIMHDTLTGRRPSGGQHIAVVPEGGWRINADYAADRGIDPVLIGLRGKWIHPGSVLPEETELTGRAFIESLPLVEPMLTDAGRSYLPREWPEGTRILHRERIIRRHSGGPAGQDLAISPDAVEGGWLAGPGGSLNAGAYDGDALRVAGFYCWWLTDGVHINYAEPVEEIIPMSPDVQAELDDLRERIDNVQSRLHAYMRDNDIAQDHPLNMLLGEVGLQPLAPAMETIVVEVGIEGRTNIGLENTYLNDLLPNAVGIDDDSYSVAVDWTMTHLFDREVEAGQCACGAVTDGDVERWLREAEVYDYSSMEWNESCPNC